MLDSKERDAMIDKAFEDAFRQSALDLASKRNSRGYWEGELSSSALGTAVAVIALRFRDGAGFRNEIGKGVRWLAENANADGGFGDTVDSVSNVSTSLLSYAALFLTVDDYPDARRALERLDRYLVAAGIDVRSPSAVDAILAHYGKDFTFSVPILCACALAGVITGPSLSRIPRLPFELALFPKWLYRFLNLNVVSYAIPALVAVGIATFVRAPKRGVLNGLRKALIPRALALLESILPESGGFLEAIPLTAFVVMSLIGAGYPEGPVVGKGIAFLLRTQRAGGSWPVDIDLSTWVTALSVKAFRGRLDSYLDAGDRMRVTAHLLAIQNRGIHPFNGATPGGWGWTSFSGSVPDGDDTPCCVLALLRLNPALPDLVADAIIAGCDWLVGLQNRDGGTPTFSRGWGRLPFDQSSADLTGHAVLALCETIARLGPRLGKARLIRYRRSLDRALGYLLRAQRTDGSWIPLWFGNQRQAREQNPVYGTSRVCAYLADSLSLGSGLIPRREEAVRAVKSARVFLASVQNDDGSWGGDCGIAGTVEETALALSALSGSARESEALRDSCPSRADSCLRAARWLERNGEDAKPSPIGFYFASLWYGERLYPKIFITEAFARVTETR